MMEGRSPLSSGFLSHYPNETSVATGPFNAALNSLASSVAPLLSRGVRLNVVSPAPVVPSERSGLGVLSAEQAAQHYLQCIEGNFTNEFSAIGEGSKNNQSRETELLVQPSSTAGSPYVTVRTERGDEFNAHP
jgi:hypothetical protein